MSVMFILSKGAGQAQPGLMRQEVTLPQPRLESQVSLEQAIKQRRSVRNFSARQLSLEQLSQLLWSAQGITEQGGELRSAPSAGAIYPMELYALNQDGVFHYLPQAHKLEQVIKEDLRQKLSRAALGQGFVASAPLTIVITASYEKVTARYGQRGRRYTDIEAGHIAQNIHLQAVALGLCSVPVGAFDDQQAGALLQLPNQEVPLYIIPVGYPR